MVERWNGDTETVEQRWWNIGPVMVEEWNNDGGRMEH